MADVPTAEGGRTRKSGTNWLLIGGLGVGAVILLVLLTRGGGGGGASTTAAGTSINASLGDILYEQMQLHQHLGETENRLNTELGDINNNVVLSNQNAATMWQTFGSTLVNQIAANRMVLSQMPGGQEAYQRVVDSMGVQAMSMDQWNELYTKIAAMDPTLGTVTSLNGVSGTSWPY